MKKHVYKNLDEEAKASLLENLTSVLAFQTKEGEDE